MGRARTGVGLAVGGIAVEQLAAIYVRVSTEEQKSRGYSLPEQVKACRARVQALVAELSRRLGHPVAVVERLFEDSAPGDILERPALSALREWVRARRPAWVVCLDPDRLARRLALQCLLADELDRRGTQLVFVQHDIDRTSPEGRAFFQMRGIMAELEKAKILERTGRGKRGKLARGGVPHNVQPYGWDYDPANGTYRVNPVEQIWVRQIFRWAAAGLTPARVAARLTGLGVPTPSARRRERGVARRWHTSTVRALLQSRAYVGELLLNRADWRGIQARRQLPLHLRRALAADDGGPLRPQPRPRAAWIRLQIPPLVEQELFDRAQAALAGRRPARTQRLLSGLAGCGLCDGPVYYEQKRRGLYLVCRNRYGGSRSCTLPLHRAAPLEQAVWARAASLPPPPPVASVPDAGEQAELQRLVAQKQAARGVVLDLLQAGTISPEQARGRLERLAGEIAALESRLVAARADQPTAVAPATPAPPAWPPEPGPDHGAWLRLRVERVLLRPDSFTLLPRT